MAKVALRDRILAAITEHDASPIITPIQLADALALAVEAITSTIAPQVQKDWMNKLEICKKYNISNYTLKKILTSSRLSTKYSTGGRMFINAAEFDKAYRSFNFPV